MTGQSIIPNFATSDRLKERFKRAENASNTAMQVNMHRRGQVPPVTAATNNTVPAPESYFLLVATDGAAMYLPFEESTGGRAYDAVAANHWGFYDASVVHMDGPIVPVPPATDHSIRTTVDHSVVVGSPIPVGPGTWEIWVRTSETVGTPTTIGYLSTDPEDPLAMSKTRLALNADGTLTAGHYDATDTLLYSDTNPTVANTGVWHHVAAVDSGTVMLLYVDGSLT